MDQVIENCRFPGFKHTFCNQSVVESMRPKSSQSNGDGSGYGGDFQEIHINLVGYKKTGNNSVLLENINHPVTGDESSQDVGMSV